jgi:hypothetical protein
MTCVTNIVDGECILPVVEGLLPPPHDEEIRMLLYAANEFHSLAKLRLHTERTLSDLSGAIQTYGRLIRRFARTTCLAFKTQESPSEYQARMRRTAKMGPQLEQEAPSRSKHMKKFNLERFKLHALGDYPTTIRMFGTTESYSSIRVMCGIFYSGYLPAEPSFSERT